MAKIEDVYNLGMANELSINSLLSKFSVPEKSDWIKMAIKETGLSDPLTALTWDATNELSFLPIYDRSDTDAVQYRDAFALLPSTNAFSNARSWLNLPPVAATDAGVANEAALEHLAKGADGIFFFGTGDIERRLEAINLTACTASFPVSDYKDVEAIGQLLRNRHGKQNLNLLWESTPLHPMKLFDGFAQTHGVRALGLLVRPDDPVTELANAIFDGVTLMDHLTDAGFAPGDVLTHVHFSMSTSSDFFITLAKVRAVRLLWYQVIRAYGVDNIPFSQIFVHARCEPLNDPRFEPRGSLIRNTTASIAAICGGCDALTIFPEEGQSLSTDRVARNVSTILADEAHMNKVADPCAGAYFVETLVHTFANAAWKVFNNRSPAT